MSNSLTKILPFNPSETDAIEAWLDDLATKGFILTDISYIFASFKEASPQRIRYRIDFSPNKGLKNDSARRTMFKDLGWQYITIFSGRYTIYKTDDPFLTEFPTQQTAAKRALSWKLLVGRIALLFATCLALLYFEYLNRQVGLMDSLLHNTSIPILFLMLIPSVLENSTHRYFHDKEQNGHNATVGRARMQLMTKLILPALLFSLCLGIQFGFEKHTSLLPDDTDSLHFPLLEEINSSPPSHLSYENFMIIKHHLLTPRTIEFYQFNHYASKQYDYYKVEYYQTLHPQLAKWHVAELSRKHNMTQLRLNQSSVQAWYSETEELPILLLQYQNNVIMVHYQGTVDLRDCISLYEAHLRSSTNARL